MKRPYGRRSMVVRVVAAATVGAALLALAACGGSSSPTENAATGKPAKIPPSSPFAEPPAGVIDGHQLTKPECLPAQGRRWVFPGPQDISSTRYEMFAINYPCDEAKKWTERLLRTKIPVYAKTGNETVLKGPKGYYCSAWPDKAGYAYAGGCQIKEGQKAFGWNWNVLNRRVVMDPDENGTPVRRKLMGSDVGFVISHKGDDRYLLDVRNTSYIGYVDRFSWTPPPGWTITGLTKVTGGHCELAATGIVWCSGKLKHPTCTCRGDGDVLSIEFTANVPPNTWKNGHPVIYGAAHSLLQIRKMTPVPYLVPQNPEALKEQKDI